jgi:molybdenum cofactor synthesis domain-containing protein
MTTADDRGVTAALLVIGDEILSGRTKDKNIGSIAEYLTAIGIDLKEVRVVSDDRDAIVEAVNALRARNTYLFTTGGIGPTHDDITADAISQALGIPLYEDPRIIAAMLERLKPEDLNEARRRMARTARMVAATGMSSGHTLTWPHAHLLASGGGVSGGQTHAA